ncbi:MAG: HEAT repeat domain-containing protein [Phycisphaerales bacterium]|nr:HEAT repeat domain-containing protein [Phycisphaerales bacterium]
MRPETVIWIWAVARGASCACIPCIGAAAQASQQAPPSAVAAEAQTPPRASQIDEFKRSILDPTAEPAARRTVSNLLIRVGTPEAFRGASEILDAGAQPAAQKSLCEAILQTASESPELFDLPEAELLVDRLSVLIGQDDGELRARAVAALSALPRRHVVGKMLAVAADAAVPESRRLAAIDALARHVHLRLVTGLFIRLLDDASANISQRSLLALAPVSRTPLGARTEDWKAWWRTQESLSEQEWLESRVDLLSARERALDAQRIDLQSALDRQGAALNTRIADLQSDLLLALPEQDREAKLVTWLSDPMPAICGGAMQLVLRRISDASGAPPESVRAAVVKNVEHLAPEVRRRALQVIGAIKDPADAALVHDRLGRETDPMVRQTALTVLGQLKSTGSLAMLLAEIGNPQAPAECVAAAARAVAEIALSRPEMKPADWDPAAAALKDRLGKLGESGNGLRAAVVEAMAALAHPALEGDLLAEVDRAEPAVQRAAIRGLVRLRNVTKLARIRALTGAADAPVRQTACEALGQIGGEDADIETLLQRVKPGAESQAPVRDTAWIAMKSLLSRHTVEQQWAWLDRLSDAPALQVEYLTELTSDHAPSRLDAAQLLIARERLGAALVAGGRWNDAVDPLQKVFEQLATQKDARALEAGLKVVDAMLRADDPSGLAVWVPRIASLGPDAQTQVAARIEAYLNSDEVRAKSERRAAVARHIENIPKDGLGEGWKRLMDALKEPAKPTPGQLSSTGP